MFGASSALLFPEELTGPVLVAKDMAMILPQLKTLYSLGDCGKKLFGPSLSRGARSHMNKFLRALLGPLAAKPFIQESDEEKMRSLCDNEIESKGLAKHVDGDQKFKVRYRGKLQEHEATTWNEIRDCHLEGECCYSYSFTCFGCVRKRAANCFNVGVAKMGRLLIQALVFFVLGRCNWKDIR